MPVETALQMIPNPRKGKLRLTYVEDHLLIAEKIKIQMLPLGRALFDEDESFQRQDDVWVGHISQQ